MAGRSCWVVTLDRIGNITQVRGLTEALGLAVTWKIVAPNGLFKLIAPFGPPPPGEKFGCPGSAFAPPWPDIAIGIGRAAVPYLRAIGRHSRRGTFTIMMMDPRIARAEFDVIWVPDHDAVQGANVLSTPFALHAMSPVRLEGLRLDLPEAIRALPAPRVTVVLGGRNKNYRYPDTDHRRLAGALASLKDLGCSFLVTPSRRSHPELVQAVTEATAGAPRVVYDGVGDNPYPLFLAAADAVVVTGDSGNMTSEALATGRPVYVFVPSGDGGKFDVLHRALYATGTARPLPDRLTRLDFWPAAAVYATDVIAREVERRWTLARRPQSAAAGRALA